MFLVSKIEDLNHEINFKILTVSAFEGEHFDLASTESNFLKQFTISVRL